MGKKRARKGFVNKKAAVKTFLITVIKKEKIANEIVYHFKSMVELLLFGNPIFTYGCLPTGINGIDERTRKEPSALAKKKIPVPSVCFYFESSEEMMITITRYKNRPGWVFTRFTDILFA